MIAVESGISGWRSDVFPSDLGSYGWGQSSKLWFQKRPSAGRSCSGAQAIRRWPRTLPSTTGNRTRISEQVLALKSVQRRRAAMPSGLRGSTPSSARSEEHTSELQSLMRISYAVFCLKKKKTNKQKSSTHCKKEQISNNNNSVTQNK